MLHELFVTHCTNGTLIMNPFTKPMESWSILSDHVKYVQHDESDNLHNVNFDSLNYHIQCQSLLLQPGEYK